MASVKILSSYTAEALADNDVRYCDCIIFVKDEYRALMYKTIIETFSGSRHADHISGNTLIVTDQKVSKIEGCILVGYNRLPGGIKTSYPFKLQSKNYDDTYYKELLERYGCTSEKELRNLWQLCSTKFCFPLLGDTADKEELSNLVQTSRQIIEERKNKERQAATADLDKFVVSLDKWFMKRFGKDNYRFVKNWSTMEWMVTAHDGHGSRTFKIVLSYFRNTVSNDTVLYLSALDNTYTILKGQSIIDPKSLPAITDKIDLAFKRWADVIVARHKLKEVFS